MKKHLALLLCLCALPFAAMGQNPFYSGPGAPEGGSSSSSDAPWKDKSFHLNPKTRIKLDFQNASIDAIVKFFSDHSGITIVKDPALTGMLSISTPKAVTLNDAFTALQANLNLKNYEIAKQDNLLVIRQRNQNTGFDMSRFFTPGGDNPFGGGSNMNLKVYPITYANASQVARVINDVFSGTGTDPISQLMQAFGNRGGGPGGRGNQFNRGGGGGQNPFQRLQFGGGGNQPQVKASYDDFSNTVIVNAPNDMQNQVQALLKQIDKPTDDPQKSKVFPLKFASADDLVTVVQNVLNSNAPRGRGGATTSQQQGPQAFINAFRGVNAGSGQVVADDHTNSLIVTATQDNLETVQKVLTELDVDVKIQPAAFVIPLNNAKADQISQLFQQAFGTRQGVGGGAARPGTTGNGNNQANRPTTQGGNNNNRAGGGGNNGRLGGNLPDNGSASIGSDGKNIELALENPNDVSGDLMTNVGVNDEVTALQGGGQFRIGGQLGGQRNTSGSTQTGRDQNGQLVNVRDLTGQITVIPDINTNSLIVVGTPDQADLVRSIIEQLDKIPEQVMIETMIVEANLDATTKLGVEWKYLDKHNGVQQTFGDQTNTTSPPQGLLYTFTGNLLSSFLHTIQTDNNFTILSTPRIFTSNNVQAQINVSQSIPYVLSTIQDANGNLSFNYAFQDVGIVLTVNPRITSNGYVTLDVTQTANDLQGFTSFNAPIINQREADTQVSVKDGETIVLGGIIRNNVTVTTNKIPILGDIPILGNLFKSTTKEKTKTELLVLLTPHVVTNPDDARKLRQQQTKDLSQDSQKNIDKEIKQQKGTNDDTAPPPVKKSGGG